MTDKQIIDITQCPFYREGKICTYLPFESKCEGDCNWTAYKEMEEQLDQLKAEVKSKTEYIQEQREIINQYSKEIEMYKKCQGKRASKREEELKAENDLFRTCHDNEQAKRRKFEQCLTEIKEIAENVQSFVDINLEDDVYTEMDKILQKISECDIE